MLTCGSSVISDVVVMTEPVSEQVDPRRTKEGRWLDGNEGVLEWRISNRLPRETGWTSGTPLRKANVLTWTVLRVSSGYTAMTYLSLLCVAMYSFRGSQATP